MSEDYYPDRALLGAVFKDPRLMRAVEALFQRAGAPGANFVTGDIKASASDAEQSGWLACDGSAVSRTQFADLFAVIATTWGSGDGSSTFNLPDLRGRSLVGYDATHPLGSTGGAATVVLTTAELPAHSHPVDDPGHTHAFAGVAHTHTFTGTAHNHGVTDGGHTHPITDPGHDHGITGVTAANGTTGVDAVGAADAMSATATTGITVDSATTGVTVNNTTATGTNANTTATGANAVEVTGITTENTGSGDPLDIQSPYAAVAYLIKT